MSIWSLALLHHQGTLLLGLLHLCLLQRDFFEERQDTHKFFDSFNAHQKCKPPKLNASPRRRWASTGLGGELQPQRHGPSPSRGSGHAGSACRQHSEKRDAPASIFL